MADMKREPTNTVYSRYSSHTGIETWRLDGKRHREDGPAMIHDNGSKSWWINGMQHREDGPAVTLFEGTKIWYVKGRYHRIDGPAIMWSHLENTWWINGNEYNFNDWCKRVNLSLEKIVEMKLLYG